jgi:excisionase family DNA binding protein
MSNIELFTVAEAATLLNVHQGTVRRWIGMGVLDAIILPHKNERQSYRIKKEIVEKARRSGIRDKGLP